MLANLIKIRKSFPVRAKTESLPLKQVIVDID